MNWKVVFQASRLDLMELGKSFPARIVHPMDIELAVGWKSRAPRVPSLESTLFG